MTARGRIPEQPYGPGGDGPVGPPPIQGPGREREPGGPKSRSAQPILAIAVAVAVVVLAAVVTAVASPGPGRHSSAADGKAPHGPAQPGAGGGGGTGGTGTSPSTGHPTTPPAVPVVPDSIQHAAETPGKAVNITIDDGPDPVWTPKVLQVLKKHHVHATFCMIGPQARDNPAVVREVVAAGHRLCDHTVHHDEGMDKKSVAYQKSEIMGAYSMIEKASGGARVYYYRAPGGAFTPASRAYAAQHGMRPLGWNVDTKDYERKGVASIVGTVKYEIGNGPTILFHDGGGERSQTVAALDQTLTWLHSQGYAFSFPKVD
ncbi:Peptidoglycan/xylan/chitin deacetylase, PgdA/CDA1 family [Actinacidiphila yanglinensis]|uniref:Peptidoglycan/xylan/chitin deacetylase, PgdA/CDA1 family n=1 Tax=Actinacidiphila yanglinensis TaxID=310779 RepID=A0A1H5VMX5_9ACTN|nr:polysaccharide deacetylase family protein [Actinacidiphila yanglinensis]SEF87877.1 Peptidoglycan/xylan/chitin deacetylase, PgdA/CDA1 family [Actinacidiphila yanglinensis]